MSVNTLDTVYDFGYDIHAYSTITLLALVVLPIAALVCVLLEMKIATVLTVIAAGFVLYNANIFPSDTTDNNAQFEQRLRTAVNEQQDDFDNSVNAWLVDHHLTRDELCTSRIVMDALTMEVISANDTLVCGYGDHSVRPGMFVLDNHDAVVFAGDDRDSVVMMYREKNNDASDEHISSTNTP